MFLSRNAALCQEALRTTTTVNSCVIVAIGNRHPLPLPRRRPPRPRRPLRQRCRLSVASHIMRP